MGLADTTHEDGARTHAEEGVADRESEREPVAAEDGVAKREGGRSYRASGVLRAMIGVLTGVCVIEGGRGTRRGVEVAEVMAGREEPHIAARATAACRGTLCGEHTNGARRHVRVSSGVAPRGQMVFLSNDATGDSVLPRVSCAWVTWRVGEEPVWGRQIARRLQKTAKLVSKAKRTTHHTTVWCQ